MSMKAFRYERPATGAAAARSGREGSAALKAGGTDLLDRMKERIDEPDRLLALEHVQDASMRSIVATPDGGLHVGALLTLTQIAASKEVRGRFPALAEAAGRAASPQIRNRATLGGNLAQHTRCGYYRHESFPCLKRGHPTCPVLEDGAVQDTAAVFDNRPCASAHPSSVAPVVAALPATVVVDRGGKEPERVPIGSFFRTPERGRAGDTVLEPGDLIVAVEFAALPKDARTGYEEVRQKAAFDWALVSCAVVVEEDRSVAGRVVVKNATVRLGSVAPTPYAAAAAEKALVGNAFVEATARAAGDAAAEGATPLAGNAYKVELVRVAVRRALLQAMGRKR
jgi:xanthine dehydrogenase YagS FAD-binding subunit